jgi:hypothetical protein
MVYTLASHVKDWLDQTFVDDLRSAAAAAIDRARRAEEEVRRGRKHGRTRLGPPRHSRRPA